MASFNQSDRKKSVIDYFNESQILHVYDMLETNSQHDLESILLINNVPKLAKELKLDDLNKQKLELCIQNIQNAFVPKEIANEPILNTEPILDNYKTQNDTQPQLINDSNEIKIDPPPEEESKWTEDCDLHHVFNGYVCSNTQLLDVRDYFEYEKCHIRQAAFVDLNNVQESMEKSIVIPVWGWSKKIICYDNNCSHNKKKYESLYEYFCKTKGCTSFTVTSNSFTFEKFKKEYPFICASTKEEKNMENENDKYPNVILPSMIYLGNAKNRNMIDCLQQIGITHIVDVTTMNFTNKCDMEILKIELEDMPSSDLNMYFEKAVDFINLALLNDSKNKVFIHCHGGISRSCTITIAYLMKYQNYSLCEAYKLCQKCRPIIKPNNGFFEQLVKYETEIYGKSTENEVNKLSLREKQECVVM